MMKYEHKHPTTEELMLAADGELSTRRAAQIQEHLAACWDCRAEMSRLNATIVEFMTAHHRSIDLQIPPVAGPRALLSAQLTGLAAQHPLPSRPGLRLASTLVAGACAALLAGVLFGWIALHQSPSQISDLASAGIENGAVPNRGLTPGATVPIATSTVCLMPHEEVVAEVPSALRETVLREYGIVSARSNEYEIDYLIAPGLGGKEDIHNLWPEPFESPTWNARVKDSLEEYLHQLVCNGQLDIATAQRDIATDWIAAYKKYFHTDRPLVSGNSRQPAATAPTLQRYAIASAL